MAKETVRIKGLRELQRDLKKISSDVGKELTVALRLAAEPVRATAESRSTGIRNIGPVWGQMRIGVSAKSVYVAPKTRRHGGSPRPNLAELLLHESMLPALDERQGEVIKGVEDMLDTLGRKHGF